MVQGSPADLSSLSKFKLHPTRATLARKSERSDRVEAGLSGERICRVPSEPRRRFYGLGYRKLSCRDDNGVVLVLARALKP